MPINITTTSFPNGETGVPYHQPVVTDSNTASTISVLSGSLPAGLSLLPGTDRNKIRNASGQGAVAGTPGTLPTNWTGTATLDGVSRSVIGTGTDGTTGLQYVDIRLSGTSSTGGTQIPLTFDSTSQVSAAIGQAWVPSLYVAVVSGSTANFSAINVRHRYYNSGGTALTARDTALLSGLSGTLTRFVCNGFAATDAATASTMAMLAVDYTNSSAIDITLRIAGVQLESLTTANALRNASTTGSSAGNPGTLPTYWNMASSSAGLSREVIGTGTEDGNAYIDIKISGTSTSATSWNLEFDTLNPTSAAQNWTASANVRVVAGSMANITNAQIGINEHNSSGTYLIGSAASFTPTSSAQRWAFSRVITSGTVAHTRPFVGIVFGSGAVIDVTLRIAAPSMQQGGAASYTDPRYTYISGTPTQAGTATFTLRSYDGSTNSDTAFSPGITVVHNERLVGQAATVSRGTLTATGEASTSVSGIGLVSATGVLTTVSTTVATLSGLGLSAAQGTTTTTGTASTSISGFGLATTTGTVLTEVAGSVNATLSGLSATSAVGSPSAAINIVNVLTGHALQPAFGALAATTTVNIRAAVSWAEVVYTSNSVAVHVTGLPLYANVKVPGVAADQLPPIPLVGMSAAAATGTLTIQIPPPPPERWRAVNDTQSGSWGDSPASQTSNWSPVRADTSTNWVQNGYEN